MLWENGLNFHLTESLYYDRAVTPREHQQSFERDIFSYKFGVQEKADCLLSTRNVEAFSRTE